MQNSENRLESSHRDQSINIQQLEESIKACTKCELCFYRTNAVVGETLENTDVLFIGEGPGDHEDLQGLPFVGRSGKALREKLVKYRVKNRNVSIVNVVKCRPPGNRAPTQEEINSCWDYLEQQIRWTNPKIIVCLGKTAAWTILYRNKSIPQNKIPSISSTFQTIHRFTLGDITYPVITMYHPSYWLRNTAKSDYWVNMQFKFLKDFLDDSGKS